MGDAQHGERVTAGDRRLFFKAALGVGLGIGAGTAPAGAMPRNPISWVHGNSATVVDAQGLERDRMEGNARVVHGRSWSMVPLHYAIPSPVLDTGAPLKVTAMWVRMKAGQGATLNAMALHDCERTLARFDKLDLRRDDWADVRLALDPPCAMVRSLGVTLECTFADVARQIGISAIGCEFEMTI